MVDAGARAAGVDLFLRASRLHYDGRETKTESITSLQIFLINFPKTHALGSLSAVDPKNLDVVQYAGLFHLDLLRLRQQSQRLLRQALRDRSERNGRGISSC